VPCACASRSAGSAAELAQDVGIEGFQVYSPLNDVAVTYDEPSRSRTQSARC